MPRIEHTFRFTTRRDSASSPHRVLLVAGLLLASFVAVLFALPVPSEEGEAEAAASEVSSTPDREFAVVGARVFDGRKTWPKADVWVRDGRIQAIGESLDLPGDLETLDGAGHTLFPGLFDAHVHAWAEARADAARFGITTLLDQFTNLQELSAAREDRQSGGATTRADLFSAGFLATAEGGHGTQYGLPVPTLEGPDSAAAWVEERKSEGSDWIKIVVERGWRREQAIPTLDLPTVRALIEAAHAENLKAVVHVSELDDALAVAEMGADGLVHVWSDRLPEAAEVAALARSGLFVIPTLVVLEGMVDPSPSRKLAELEGFADRLTAAQRQGLEQAFPETGLDFRVPFESVRKLIAAGVPILAGSDAPNPATAMGLSVHRELELLVSAGLTPEQALRSATSASADAFGIPDRGRIRAGGLADLVLVEGDPTADIVHTRRSVRVWKAGREIERDAPESALGEAEAGAESAATPEETVLADFELGLGSRFGSGWVPTTDQMRGGRSEAFLEVKDGVLVVAGEVKAGFAFPWAGAMVFVGPARMDPVDLSPRQELRFRVRGDGRTYLVMFFSGESPMPSRQLFEAGEEWREVVLPLEGFSGGDPARARAFAFTAGSPAGEFRLEIDDVEVR